MNQRSPVLGYLAPLKLGQRRARGEDMPVKLVAGDVARRLAQGLARGPARRQGLKDMICYGLRTTSMGGHFHSPSNGNCWN